MPTAAKMRSLADRADPYDLYERAVQDPDRDVRYLVRWFRRYRGRRPLHLREDFCGTGALCAAWVLRVRGGTAEGIDRSPRALSVGRQRHLSGLGPGLARRIRFVEADVRAAPRRPVDVTCALNFSYFTFHTRADLSAYFRRVRAGLRSDGLFVLDVLGGSRIQEGHEERREVGDAVYVWRQGEVCPLSHRFRAAIDFEFPDGSRLSGAFRYDWRLWTVPELADALGEAGFSRVHRLWERTGADGDFCGALYEPKGPVEPAELWWTYLVAEA